MDPTSPPHGTPGVALVANPFRVTRYRIRMALVVFSLIAMCTLAAASLNRVYTGHLLTILVVASAFGAIAIGILFRNRSGVLSSLMSVTGLALMLAISVLATTDLSEPFPVTFVDALINAVPRTLTALLPVDAAPDTVVLPVLLTWVAAALGGELAVRFGLMLAGIAPAVVLYAGSLYLVGPNADFVSWWALAFAAIAGLSLAATASEPAERPDRDAVVGDGLGANTGKTVAGRLASGGAAALLGLVMVMAAPIAGGMVTGQPDDPRQYVEPPELTDRDLNPLIRISGWTQTPEQELLHTNLDEEGWLRLAVLTEYDGVTWQTGNDYLNAGSVLPGSDPGPGPYTQDITVAELDGKLLPAADDPRTVSGLPVAIDDESRTLLTPDGLTSGDSYEITSELPDVDVSQVTDSSPDQSSLELLDTPASAPEIMLTLAEHIRETYDTPAARAEGLAEFLGTHYAFDEDAPSGHAYPNLEFFLQAHPEHGGQRGTSEQFAATYAVVARMLGLPSRIVIGFHAPAGDGVVTAGDALAWPEVKFADVGWVRFDPMPQPDTEPIPPEDELEIEEEEEEEEEDDSSGENTEDYHDDSLEESDANLDHDQAFEDDSTLPIWFWFLFAGFLVVSIPAALKLHRHSQLKRRLHTGTPAERVEGAWRELLFAAGRLGIRIDSSVTAAEAMVVIGTPVPDDGNPKRFRRLRALVSGPRVDRQHLQDSIDALPQLVNHATFAPHEVTEDQAFAAMRCVKRFVALGRSYLPLWKKVLT